MNRNETCRNWFKDLGKGIGQFVVRDVWGRAIYTFSCPFTTTGAYGTTLACFPDNSMQKIRVLGALDYIATDPRADFTNVTLSNGVPTQHYFQPSTFSIGRMAYILDGYSSEATVYALGGPGENSDAVSTEVATGTSAPVIVRPAAYGHYPTNGGLAPR